MKKIVLALVAILIIGACLPLTPTPGAAPTVDVARTVEAAANISVAQTLTALPMPTSHPVTKTFTPTQTPVLGATESPTTTLTPKENLTTTPATATSGALNPTFTNTVPPSSGSATLTPTLGILTYGTLPPAVPFSNITLFNKSKTQAYISLQVTTATGGPTILEYPVERIVEIQAPVGYYLYVAWVGGNKMVGNFRLPANDDLLITLFKDKVVIQ